MPCGMHDGIGHDSSAARAEEGGLRRAPIVHEVRGLPFEGFTQECRELLTSFDWMFHRN